MALINGSIGYLRLLARGGIPDEHEDVYAEAVQGHAFLPIDPDSEQQEACGWVRWDDALEADFGGHGPLCSGDVMLLRMRIDTLKVPAGTLKAHVRHRVRAIRSEQKRPKLTRDETSQVTSDVRKRLRQESLPKMSEVEAVWSMPVGEIRLLATSRRTVALFIDLFEKTFALKLDVMGPRNLLMMRGMEDEDLALLEMSEPERLHLHANPPDEITATEVTATEVTATEVTATEVTATEVTAT